MVLVGVLLLSGFLARLQAQPPNDTSTKQIDNTNSSENGGNNKTIQWTVEGPTTPWNISHSRTTEFQIVRSEQAPTEFILTRAVLVDSSSGKGWELPLRYLQLCRLDGNKPTDCANKLTVNERKTAVLLKTDDAFTDDGSFVGTIELDTRPFTQTKSLSLTVQQSKTRSRGIGLSLLIGGVTIAWLVLSYGRGKLSRNQALLPAFLLRDRLAEIMRQLQSIPDVLGTETNTTRNTISTLIGKLTPAYLDSQQFLPPELPSPGGAASVQVASYQAFLQNSSQVADSLNVLVAEGLLPAGRLWSPQMPAPSLAALKTLISNLDALSAGLPQALPLLRTSIKNYFDRWNAHPQLQIAGQAASPLVMPAAQHPTVMSLFVRIELFTGLFWVVWAVLAVIVGGLVLIVPSPGFGGVMDYARCFLWGFGLPVAGQSIQQLTMSSLNSSFGVNISR
jgi:hypothetical protein